jgi:serine/threonine protein phosphatase PrpC
MILVHGQQVLGRRDKQEDSFSIIRQNDQDPSSDILLLLADGMGGHTGGEVASNLAVEAFGRHFVRGARSNRPLERLQECLQVANEALRLSLARDPSLRGMGCTMIGAIKIANNLHWISVGDSLIYLMRRGEIGRINADHSVLGELMERVEQGKLTRAEALAHPRRNALRSAVMGGQISLKDARTILLEPDDVLIFASDGLETLSPSEIAEILSQSPRAPREAATALLQAVERRKSPSQDNATVIVYWHSDGMPSAFYQDSKWSFSGSQTGASLLKAGLVAGFVAAAAVLAFFFMQPAQVPLSAKPVVPEQETEPSDSNQPKILDTTKPKDDEADTGAAESAASKDAQGGEIMRGEDKGAADGAAKDRAREQGNAVPSDTRQPADRSNQRPRPRPGAAATDPVPPSPDSST